VSYYILIRRFWNTLKHNRRSLYQMTVNLSPKGFPDFTVEGQHG